DERSWPNITSGNEWFMRRRAGYACITFRQRLAKVASRLNSDRTFHRNPACESRGLFCVDIQREAAFDGQHRAQGLELRLSLRAAPADGYDPGLRSRQVSGGNRSGRGRALDRDFN